MILGDYRVVDGRTMTDISDSEDEETIRLRFIEKSLQMELDYIRRLRSLEKGIDDVGVDAADSSTPPTCESGGVKSDAKEGERVGSVSNVIHYTIHEGTWPAWAVLASKDTEAQTYNIDHEYDYDWLTENGFAWMHDMLNCRKHAHDQKKPMYTSEMWMTLWRAFQDSTLFPFPIPEPGECPEKPIYVGQTTDNKGRGNFAARNLKKGSLVHAGQPSTVFFLDADSWYRFVSLLPTMMACDVMEWVWQQDMTNDGNIVMCLNMDEAVFFNDGSSTAINMELKEKTSLNFYATEDIEKGEEVLYDYTQFDFDTLAMKV